MEVISNYKALKYQVEDNGENIGKIPVYKHWLDMIKTEVGDNGVVLYCTKCHLFFY